jgi:hypothetical protein
VPQELRRWGGRRDRYVGRRRGLVDDEVGGVVDPVGDGGGGLRSILGGVGRLLGAVGVTGDLLDDLLDVPCVSLLSGGGVVDGDRVAPP